MKLKHEKMMQLEEYEFEQDNMDVKEEKKSGEEWARNSQKEVDIEESKRDKQGEDAEYR